MHPTERGLRFRTEIETPVDNCSVGGQLRPIQIDDASVNDQVEIDREQNENHRANPPESYSGRSGKLVGTGGASRSSISTGN